MWQIYYHLHRSVSSKYHRLFQIPVKSITLILEHFLEKILTEFPGSLGASLSSLHGDWGRHLEYLQYLPATYTGSLSKDRENEHFRVGEEKMYLLKLYRCSILFIKNISYLAICSFILPVTCCNCCFEQLDGASWWLYLLRFPTRKSFGNSFWRNWRSVRSDSVCSKVIISCRSELSVGRFPEYLNDGSLKIWTLHIKLTDPSFFKYPSTFLTLCGTWTSVPLKSGRSRLTRISLFLIFR